MNKFAISASVSLIASCATVQNATDDSAVAAADQAQSQRPNPCDAAPYRAFDFWLGAWEVFDTEGNKAGDNVISKQEYGCLLLEEWINTQGGTGQSYNFYDPGRQKFRQVWVSKGAVIDYAGGLNGAGEMILEGDIHYHAGTSAPFKGTWTPQDDGSVRQYFQQYNGETKMWEDWFTGIYKKKDAKD